MELGPKSAFLLQKELFHALETFSHTQKEYSDQVRTFFGGWVDICRFNPTAFALLLSAALSDTRTGKYLHPSE